MILSSASPTVVVAAPSAVLFPSSVVVRFTTATVVSLAVPPGAWPACWEVVVVVSSTLFSVVMLRLEELFIVRVDVVSVTLEVVIEMEVLVVVEAEEDVVLLKVEELLNVLVDVNVEEEVSVDVNVEEEVSVKVVSIVEVELPVVAEVEKLLVEVVEVPPDPADPAVEGPLPTMTYGLVIVVNVGNVSSWTNGTRSVDPSPVMSIGE